MLRKKITTFDIILYIVCLTPALVLSLKGSISAIVYVTTLFFLLSLAKKHSDYQELWRSFKLLFLISLSYPLYIVIQMIGFDIWKGSRLEYILRFLLFIPLVSVLAISNKKTSALLGFTSAFGALIACVFGVVSITIEDLSFQNSARAWNFYTNPIPYGNISLLLGFVSFIPLLIHEKTLKPSQRLVLIIGFVSGITASLLSGARGGWVAMPILLGIIFLLTIKRKQNPLNFKLISLVLVIIISPLLFFHELIYSRLNFIFSDITLYFSGVNKYTSVGARLDMWLAALTLWLESPLFGIGIGQLKAATSELIQTKGFPEYLLDYNHSHNDFLFVLAEQGLIGLSLFISYYILPFVYFISFLKKENKEQFCLALMGITVVLAFFIFGLTEAMQAIMFQLSFYITIIALLMARLWQSEHKFEHD